jgi:hypothetical protein
VGVGAGAEMRRPALISVHALHVHFSGLCAGGGFLRGSALSLRAGGGGLLLGRGGIGGGGSHQPRGIGLVVATVRRQGLGAAATRLVLLE